MTGRNWQTMVWLHGMVRGVGHLSSVDPRAWRHYGVGMLIFWLKGHRVSKKWGDSSRAAPNLTSLSSFTLVVSGIKFMTSHNIRQMLDH